ncbi:MAG: heat-inducible transcriptional repressor HrcA [Actinobacteria bacterium]|nr:heat-inducible transcriptional repressor HrcA [Actinomycetota bacterium]
MLDDRKAAILRAVVSEYIKTAQPVGSSHIAASPGIGVSSATVRGEMVHLESEGYLVQPHTSAGRVPTEKGYRFFVDQLGGVGRLGAAQRMQVREFFASAHGEIEYVLEKTSRLLAQLTGWTALVVEPPADSSVIRAAQIVDMGGSTALAVLVLSNGVVEKYPIELPSELDCSVIGEASARLAARVIGKHPRSLSSSSAFGERLEGDRPDSSPGPLSSAGGDRSSSEGSAAGGEGAAAKQSSRTTGRGSISTAEDLVDAVCFAIGCGEGSAESGQVFVGGASQMAAAFDAVETVREVLGILEQHLVVVTLLRDVLDRGLSVAIGVEEHGLEPLAACSVVVAPYEVEGKPSGTVGVLGPTRMDYPRALAAVSVVGEQLSERWKDAGRSGSGSRSGNDGGVRAVESE